MTRKLRDDQLDKKAFAKQRLELIEEQIDTYGWAHCEWCPKGFTPETAKGIYGLHAHHIVHRSQMGSDKPENLALICGECHWKHHN